MSEHKISPYQVIHIRDSHIYDGHMMDRLEAAADRMLEKYAALKAQQCECAVDFGADLTGENAQPCGKDVEPGTRFCKNHSECGE